MKVLTFNQAKVLEVLTDGPLKTAAITKQLNDYDRLTTGNKYNVYWTWDQVHSILRRLEDRGLVRRISDSPTEWEITQLGKQAKNYPE